MGNEHTAPFMHMSDADEDHYWQRVEAVNQALKFAEISFSPINWETLTLDQLLADAEKIHKFHMKKS